MATILLVDDRPTNREFLATLLGYANHRCLEAGDGAAALDIARTQRPDLIVTDLLMPTMDGHEFVQRLRDDPAIASIPVIFYSATYTVPEATKMAEGCGVRTVLPKPSDPEIILKAVDRELGLPPGASAHDAARLETLDFALAMGAEIGGDRSLDACLAELRETARALEEMAQRGESIAAEERHLRPLSTRLRGDVQRLGKAASRRVAIDELCVRLMGEKLVVPMVDLFTLSASRILDASLAAVCVLDSRERDIVHLSALGVNPEVLRPGALDRRSPPGSLLDARAPVRIGAREGPSQPWPTPFGEGAVLGLPVRTSSQLHGWICFGGRSIADGFDEEDERIALSLSARLAVVYENVTLFDTVQRHSARLQVETGERERSRLRLMESEQRFRQIAENIKEVFWLTDPAKNTMLYISPAYDEIWGRRSDDLYSNPRAWLDAIHPDDRERVVHAAQTRQARGEYAEEYRIVRPDDSWRWISDKAFPVVDDDGRVYRIAGVAEDVTERRRAEAEIARTTRALRMLSACNEALIRAEEEDSLLQRICQIAVEVGGYRIARVGFLVGKQGGPVVVRAHAGETPAFLATIEPTWSSGPDGPIVSGRTLGSEAIVIERVSEDPLVAKYADVLSEAGLGGTVALPLREGARTFGLLVLYMSEGAGIGAEELALLHELAADLAFGICTIRARAERERADADLLSSLREKEALLKEVHHRVKNNMQVITSLLRLESGRADHAVTRSVLRDMQNRIQSMAALHETLYRSSSFAEVDLSDYLRQVLSHLNRSAATPGQVSFILSLAPVRLEMERAIPCGLALNELISNSLKHGFPSGRTGTIWVDMALTLEGLVRLVIRDDGVGLAQDFQARSARALGLQLVQDLARQISGKLHIGPGARFEIAFPARSPDWDDSGRV